MSSTEESAFPFTTAEDLLSPPLFTPAHRLAEFMLSGRLSKLSAPEGVILLHQAKALRPFSRRRRLRKIRGLPWQLYMPDPDKNGIGIVTGFGVGGPETGVLIEELAAFGTKKFVSLGLAGGLQQGMQAGDLVVCDRALREEGLSYHYLPPSRYAFPSPDLTSKLVSALEKTGKQYILGGSWTTDAPYREYRRKAEKYRREGIQTVEMEAAAVFAVCTSLGLTAASAFCVADRLDAGLHRTSFHPRLTMDALVVLIGAAVQALEG
jgi:uridine phosphorylase